MKRRTWVGVLVVVAALGACGDDDGPTAPLLVLPTTVGTAIVDGDTGDRYELFSGAAATPDGEVLFETIFSGTVTTVASRPMPGVGAPSWSASVEGQFEARVADAAGDRVVLGPSRAGVVLEPGALAPGRTETPLAFASRDGLLVETMTVPGNVEPEAFSLDGDSLFVVNYLPPEAPTYYQVKQLDLATGELGDVFSVDAELQSTMRGTARTQTWDPDGDRLYTLYTLEGGGAFVHVLDLEEEWAHCVDLPVGIAATSAGMDLSSDGRTLYVADAAEGGVAEIDTKTLSVTDEGTLPDGNDVAFTGGGGHGGGVVPGPTPTAVAIDGRRLLIGHDTEIDVIDRGTFEALDRFSVAQPLVGLLVDEGDVYVAHQTSLTVLEDDSGEVLRHLPVAIGQGVILTLGGATPTYVGVPCAC